ncbi:MAG: hypothetical protein CMN31_26585, partial [Sandaracinus sp.]|nr:hypothetical protein [Sandaracinus sp.]HJK89567.1 hypothetical protein [Polyangiaceae bacterium LLY-WYZ-15_(1-7)]
ALEDAERVLKDAKHDPADLKPHEWADLLQIVTIKGFAQDLGWAHERARVRGLLGWGAQEHRLAEALERFDFDGHYKIGWGQDGRLGLMHFLLGCEASEDVLLHAYALYGRRRGNLMAGCVPRNFDEPLKAFGHAKQTALLLLARHLEIRKYNVIGADEILRYPVLEEASGLEGSWTSAEPRRDVRIRVSVTGASKATITLRGGIRVTLDGSERRWSVEGLPGSASGPTSLLGDERVLQLDVEAVGPLLRLGFNGTIGGEMPQGYLFEGIGTEASPIEVQTDGTLQRARVTEMRSQRAATDLARLVGFEEEGAVRDVAEGGDAAAALALAAEVSLGDDEGVAAAAKAALQELGEVGAPWREALGLDAVEAEEKVFPLRSFDACVAAFAALKDGEPKQVEGVDGYAKTVAWKSPGSPDWSDDGIAEDTLYLVEGDGWRGEGVSDAKTLMGSSIPALTTWNSRGSGDWAGEPGTWMILTCDDLMQEQDEWGNWMSVTLAAWKVEEGVAVAAWKGKREDLAKVMGLPDGWPSRRSWTSIPVWIGE